MQGIVSRYPDRTALEYLDTRISYQSLWDRSEAIAKGLIALGVGHGTHVGIWANERPDTVACLLAIFRIGAIGVLLSKSLPLEKLKARICDADVEYLLFDDGFRDICYPQICMQLETPCREHLIYIGENNSPFTPIEQVIDLGAVIDPKILAGMEASVSPSDTDLLLFTSGSCEAPHIVETSHFSRLNSAIMQAQAIKATADDKICVALPIFHCFSLTANLLCALVTGACACLAKDPHTQTVLCLISSSRCTVFSGVPSIFSALLARPDFNQWDVSSLRTGFIGGAPYPPELFCEIERRFGMTLLPSLGQTEATAGFTSGSEHDSLEIRSNTLGRIWPHIDLRMVNPKTGQDVNPYEIGEICIHGYNVMKGYYRHDDQTRQAFYPGGWLRTGDMGYLDADQRLHFFGRIKEIIIRGGENISPLEVENVIKGFPGVLDVKVVGIPSAHYGEEVAALVVSDLLDKVALFDYISKHVEQFMVPSDIFILSALPRTSNGKIDMAACKRIAMAMASSSKE